MKYLLGNLLSMLLGGIIAAMSYRLWQHNENELAGLIVSFVFMLTVRLVFASASEEWK